jgi:hypothetical protein
MPGSDIKKKSLVIRCFRSDLHVAGLEVPANWRLGRREDAQIGTRFATSKERALAGYSQRLA